MSRKNGSQHGADAELLNLRHHQKTLVEALQTLSYLLEEYAPSWYSEEHQKVAAAALSPSQRFTRSQ